MNRHFLIAALFAILIVGTIFLYLWAIVFRQAVGEGAGPLFVVKILIFAFILSLAGLYVRANDKVGETDE